MFDAALRPVAGRLIQPLVGTLTARFHPHAISLGGLAVGLTSAAFLFRQAYVAALVLWLLNRLLDALDGAVARAGGKRSDFGGYLDIMCDFAVYAVLPIAAVLALPPDAAAAAYPALAATLAAFYVNGASWMYLAAVLERRGGAGPIATTITMPAGLVEGTETIIIFSLLMLFPGHTALLLWITATLVLVTILQRIAWARQNLGRVTY